jgi:hypothetical protein
MPVCLKAVTQPWLHNSLTLFNLRNQTMHIGDQIFMNTSRVCGNNCSEQNSTKPRRWVNWQIQST